MHDASNNASDRRFKILEWRGFRGFAPRIRTINAIAVFVAAVLAIVALSLDSEVVDANDRAAQANDEYISCSNATYDLRMASDYLTSEARMFVMTQDRRHLESYFEELLVTDRRGEAVAKLQTRSDDGETAKVLDRALSLSGDLASIELYAMRLAADASDMRKLPEELAAIQLREGDAGLSDEAKLELARSKLFDDEYSGLKRGIGESAEACSKGLVEDLRAKREQSKTSSIRSSAYCTSSPCACCSS